MRTLAVPGRDPRRVRAAEVAFGRLRTSGFATTVPHRLRTFGPEVRTCVRCGEHVPFRIDPVGSWAECTACGHLN
jgi:hypothetical protein